jgi:hypothetical protein
LNPSAFCFGEFEEIGARLSSFFVVVWGFSLYREERRDRKEGLVVVPGSSKLPPIAFVADTRGLSL